MSAYSRRKENRMPIVVVGIIIVLAVAAVTVFIFKRAADTGGEEYFIETDAQADPAAVNGMIGGEKYYGAMNPYGVLSYRINGRISVDGGEGEFMIENPPKNTCLMKVTFVADGRRVYESGYIFPNQHIERDRLDTVPEPGEYTIKVIFEGFDPESLESLGTSETEITLNVK